MINFSSIFIERGFSVHVIHVNVSGDRLHTSVFLDINSYDVLVAGITVLCILIDS